MKVCVVQPLYSTDYSKSDEFFQWEMDQMDACDASMDLIVFPESCDVPCFAATMELSRQSTAKYIDRLLDKASETAKRCNAIVVINAHVSEETGLRNTTLVFDRQGKEVYRYYKQHLVPSETSVYKLDSEYTFEYEPPYVLELEGLRFGFMICYDFYFYEAYAALARKDVDIIIGCSHQRSDMHSALETIHKFLAYHTNAYLVRSSVSMGEDTTIGGCSCVVAPDGTVLADMKSKVGRVCVDIDPKAKYFKPAGYNNPPSAHYQYIEKGRRPWKYRPAGSAIVRHDDLMPYPRTCAHRGFNTVAPENSMAAFGAAVAMGAEEIEFDLWATKDGVLVSSHDPTLERVSNGTGKIYEKTYDELLQLDFGVKHGEEFKGMKILRFDEILKKFACHVIMNIHIKIWDCAFEKDYVEEIVSLVRQYDCEKWVYFMSCNDKMLRKLHDYAPDLKICAGVYDNNDNLVDRAVALGAQKVQFISWAPFSKAHVEKARAHGLICNICQADDEGKAREYMEMGVDTILTNDYGRISQIVKEYKR